MRKRRMYQTAACKKVVTSLTHDKLLRIFSRQHLRGYRLGVRGKRLLLQQDVYKRQVKKVVLDILPARTEVCLTKYFPKFSK